MSPKFEGKASRLKLPLQETPVIALKAKGNLLYLNAGNVNLICKIPL